MTTPPLPDVPGTCYANLHAKGDFADMIKDLGSSNLITRDLMRRREENQSQKKGAVRMNSSWSDAF